MFVPLMFLAKAPAPKTPFEVLKKEDFWTSQHDFYSGLGLPFLMHTILMVGAIACIIRIMLAIVQLMYVTVPQEVIPLKNSIRAALMGVVILGALPLIGDTVLGLIYDALF